MLLRARVLAVARERPLHLLARKRIESALDTIESILGDVHVDVGEVVLARKVVLPDDDAVYIVVGEWTDGTFDLVREQGCFPSDSLVGWREGQSLRSYQEELAREPLPEPENGHASRTARPLQHHGKDPR